MVEQAAEDYAKILQSINLEREVSQNIVHTALSNICICTD